MPCAVSVQGCSTISGCFNSIPSFFARLYFHGEEMRAHADERKGSPSLTWALTKAFGGAFFLGGVFKLVNDLLTFVSPQILK